MRPSAWHARFATQSKGERTPDKDNAKEMEQRQGTFVGQKHGNENQKEDMEWFVGQMVAATYKDGEADSWRKVKLGEKCAWADRIATCTKLEYQMNQH